MGEKEKREMEDSTCRIHRYLVVQTLSRNRPIPDRSMCLGCRAAPSTGSPSSRWSHTRQTRTRRRCSGCERRAGTLWGLGGSGCQGNQESGLKENTLSLAVPAAIVFTLFLLLIEFLLSLSLSLSLSLPLTWWHRCGACNIRGIVECWRCSSKISSSPVGGLICGQGERSISVDFWRLGRDAYPVRGSLVSLAEIKTLICILLPPCSLFSNLSPFLAAPPS